ncbi:asparagine synthase (glutamine-hydrolyzing) [Reichenbachiella sp. 5M10]|uniref:asparagine synthase (glutamine-hydrolyzing) n=1 Tax=Reichenbachiella sp. 5M10 TaxID=1889772 RepID=UPI000C15E0B1|nr:asparagine synthase (glutamine-hydrolyzing) [Reichenbachiella sp. 5M10]PIB34641.1 asparagine synthase (glutamine-hydrolyzing) [Reichenbachiella sp. 5M10]
MCGISGFIDFRHSLEEKHLISMTDVLEKRGPDASGYHFEKTNDGHIGLGHRRLSILDLSPLGNQPYYYEDYVVVFNGEIYNFQEIKKELEQKGMTFSSTSDTEVIIKAYACEGLACIERFIGMFAIALYDKKEQKIHLIRDRAGVKPINFYWRDNLFLFSSELKSFHQVPGFGAQLDEKSIVSYFKYSYVTSPNSIYKNTYKVKPGHVVTIDVPKKEIKETQYWDIIEVYNRPKSKLSYEEAVEELEELLISSCNYRMVSDVPVGVFLSGGYDSSTVTSILAKHHNNTIKTFTIGFENSQFDEAPYAKKISEYLGTEHTEYYCTQQEALDLVPKLPEIFDEPLGDNSIIPTTLVSQLARKHVTVALSSDAGDEIFAGYPRYTQALQYSQIMTPSLQKIASKSMNLLDPKYIPYFNKKNNFKTRYNKIREIWKTNDPVKAMEIVMQFNTNTALTEMIPGCNPNSKNYFGISEQLSQHNDPINKMLAVDYLTFLLDNNLTKVDRATMSASLEGREPLLDHRLVEFAAQLPTSYKLKQGHTKRILKSVLSKYIPNELMERPKQGFVSPINDWLKGDLREYLHEFMSPQLLKQQGIFAPQVITRMINDFLMNKGENAQKIWHLLVFQMWYYKWIEKR